MRRKIRWVIALAISALGVASFACTGATEGPPSGSAAPAGPTISAIGSPSPPPSIELLHPTFLVMTTEAAGAAVSGGRLAATGTRDDLALYEATGTRVLDTSVTSPALAGSRVAYWRVSGPGGGPNQLRVLDWTDGSAPLTVVQLQGERGLEVAWSQDGGGLVFSISSQEIVDAFSGRPRYTALRTLRLDGQEAPVEIERRTDGTRLIPLGWIRQQDELIIQDGPRILTGPDLRHGYDLGSIHPRVTISADHSAILTRTYLGDVTARRSTDGGVIASWTAPGEIQHVFARPGASEWGVISDTALWIWTPQGPSVQLAPKSGQPSSAFFNISGSLIGVVVHGRTETVVRTWSFPGLQPASAWTLPVGIRPLAVR